MVLNMRGSLSVPPQFGQLGARELIGAKATLALAQALHQRVVELADVARGDPDSGRGDQRRVEQLDVVAPLHVGAEPGVAHVVLEQHAERTVVIGIGEAAVDLGAREDEAAPFAQRDELLQVVELDPRASSASSSTDVIPLRQRSKWLTVG